MAGLAGPRPGRGRQPRVASRPMRALAGRPRPGAGRRLRAPARPSQAQAGPGRCEAGLPAPHVALPLPGSMPSLPRPAWPRRRPAPSREVGLGGSPPTTTFVALIKRGLLPLFFPWFFLALSPPLLHILREKHYNFHPRTPFLIILDSLESSQ